MRCRPSCGRARGDCAWPSSPAITPWVEAALLGLPELQHANLTTIDWNQPILAARHTLAPAWRRLRTLGQAELARHYARGERFDAIVAFSGIEHDGLGRYGDPLNPEGDLAAISEMGALLARGGLLLLGVPTAVLDDVVYPRHRLYGPGRLPWLLRGWTLLGRVGRPRGARRPRDGAPAAEPLRRGRDQSARHRLHLHAPAGVGAQQVRAFSENPTLGNPKSPYSLHIASILSRYIVSHTAHTNVTRNLHTDLSHERSWLADAPVG